METGQSQLQGLPGGFLGQSVLGEGHDRATTTTTKSPQCQTEENVPQTENKTKKGHRSWLCSTQTVEQQNGEARQTEQQLRIPHSYSHLHGEKCMLGNKKDGGSPPKLPRMEHQSVRAAFNTWQELLMEN